MKRVILFSKLTDQNKAKLLKKIFPKELKNKRLAYMPSDGREMRPKYISQWRNYALNNNSEFVVVNNSKRGQAASKEANKIRSANILIITGGNTFTLLNHLRRSGLDKAVKEFVSKDNFVLAGFSAGAIVLTPTIEVATLEGYDENKVGLKNLIGLNIVDFEVLPHYSADWEQKVNEYQTSNELKKLSDEEALIVELS